MVGRGALVEFYQDKKILCGLCLKADKKNIHLLSEENREVGLPPQRVLFSVGGFLDPTALREEVVTRLRKEAARREEIKSGIVLADLWELLTDEPGEYKVEELASTYFGTALGPDLVSGIMRALHEDRVHFERKSDLFIPNSRERVQQLLLSIQAEQNKQHEREEMVAWISEVWGQRQETGSSGRKPASTTVAKYLEWFKDAALFGHESSRFKEVQTVLSRAGVQQRDAPFQILVKTRVWHADENLDIHRHRLPVEFPPQVLEETSRVRAAASNGVWRTARRTDLTELYTVTIDDEHTVETDDAISIRAMDDGWEIGVHIADPAEFIEPGSALDREALHRGTSIYFPDLKIPMLPPAIGTDICSLRPHADRPALSVLAVLDEHGNLMRTHVVESIVRVTERRTYEGVDSALKAGTDERIVALYRLANARRQMRRASGAVFVPFPSIEVHVHVENGAPRISVRREEHDIPSHVLVSEFMILANEAVARYFIERQIPAVYRGQPPPTEPITIGDVFTPLDGFKIRRLLRKGETALDPIRHAGLGIDAYLQITSPIRRYLDLVLHRQIKHAVVQGTPLYGREDLEKIMTITGSSSDLAETMERARKTYWIFKHLEESLWEERRAHVLQVFPNRYHVQLEDTLAETDCPALAGTRVTPGDVLNVKIELVWPREGVLRVSATGPPHSTG